MNVTAAVAEKVLEFNLYNPRFNYQPIPKVTVEGKRFYATPDGNKLPSVTTILDKTKSEASKAAGRERYRQYQQSGMTVTTHKPKT